MYIDPGSGSMLMQVVVASALGSLIAFRRTLVGLWVRVMPKTHPASDQNT